MNVDKQRMIDTAVAFFLAGERLTPRFSFGVYGEHTVAAPAVSNYAMAAEIGLKILLAHQKPDQFSDVKKKNGHDLLNLFNVLSDETKEKLEFIKKWVEYNKKIFVDWRYPYESEYLCVQREPLRRIFIVIHKCIREEIPSLCSTYEKKFGKFEPDWQWAWYEQEIIEHEEICARNEGKETNWVEFLKGITP